MIYTVRRIQLYLEERMWKVLSARARQQRTTVSELVPQAVRENFGDTGARRKATMQAFVGIWAGRKDLPPTEAYVRSLRGDTRAARMGRG